MNRYLHLAPEVAAALREGQPVVALESTIIAHGMPYPQNIETARQVEAVIRDNHAIPATIAIVGGQVLVGLSAQQLEHLGRAEDIAKASRRDIPLLIASGKDGATTVAATMAIAAMAGISVFVTGGIGGVHRDAPHTFDISADLSQLAVSNVAVVCAGAKSILDIGLTLEYLETHGVPVVCYGSRQFPAFWLRSSGFTVDMQIDDLSLLARVIADKWAFGLSGGVVVANPIPPEAELERSLIETAIERAQQECHQQNIRGGAITPYLLAYIQKITNGRSLQSNIALVLNNARLGAALANQLARLADPKGEITPPIC